MPTNEPTLDPTLLPEGTYELPVGYKTPDGKLHKTVSLKEMTGLVEEKMADKKVRTNMGAVLTELIHGVVDQLGTMEKFTKMDAKGLSNIDRDYILVRNFVHSIGDEAEWVENCPKCEEALELKVDMKNLPVHYLSAEEPRLFDIELPLGIKDAEGKLHKKIQVGFVDGFTQEMFVKTIQENPIKAISVLMNAMTEKIEGMSQWNIDHFRNLTKRDRKAIQDQLNQLDVGVDFSVKAECGACGHDYSTQVPTNILLGE